ncbi:MAG: AraC family transcriptional regulator [Verrucomicrobiaceae bacterium]
MVQNNLDPANRPPKPKVGVIIGSDNPHTLGYLQGIREYSEEQGGWNLYGRNLPCCHDISDLTSWKGDGFIVGDHTAVFKPSRPAPTVGLGIQLQGPSVVLEQDLWLSAALEHLIEQGLRTFAYYSNSTTPDETYLFRIAHRLNYPFQKLCRNTLESCLDSHDEPVGIITPDCTHAVELCHVAQKVGIRIPNDLSIVSLRDDAHCSVASPKISCLSYPSREIGYQAARTLHRQLKKLPVESTTAVRSNRINARLSSSTLQCSDPIIQDALRFIHRNIDHSPVKVSDLAKALGISRANLTERFQKTLGSPPAEIIRHKRLAAAMQLLDQPGEMVKSIAISMGFSSSQEFARFFKNTAGVTPTQYVKSDSAWTK